MIRTPALTLLLALGCWASAMSQPREVLPAPRFGGLEDRARVVSVALHPEYWASYDLHTASLVRLWKGSHEAGSDGRMAIRGQVLLRSGEDPAWRVRIAGRDTAVAVRYAGLHRRDGYVVLRHELHLGGGLRVVIDETPQLLVTDAGLPELRRRFVVHDAPPDLELLLRVDLRHLASRDALAYEGLLLHEAGRRHRHGWGASYDVSGWVVLPPPGRPATLVATFDPRILRQVGLDDEAGARVARAARLPVQLRTTPGVEAGPTLIRAEGHTAGLSLAVYDIGQPMDRLAALAPGQLPNVHRLVSGVDLRHAADFGDIPFYAISHLSGYLNLSQAGDYAFRLRADDGVRFFLGDSLLIERDGRNAGHPTPPVTVYLEVGIHPIRLEHFQSTGPRQLTLEWRPPGAMSFSAVDPAVFTTREVGSAAVSPGRKHLRPETEGTLQMDMATLPRQMHPAYRVAPVALGGVEGPVGGLTLAPDGRLVVSAGNTMGNVYVVDTGSITPEGLRPFPFAEGLDTPDGVLVEGADVLVLQAHELTRLVDEEGDPSADVLEVAAAGWQRIPGYHQHTAGPVASDGAWYVAMSQPMDPRGAMVIDPVPDAGMVVRLTPDEAPQPVVTGIQLPGGLASTPDDMLLVSDIQNAWVGPSRLLLIPPDPSGIRAADSVTAVWMPRLPEQVAPTQPVWLTQGPYAGQLLLGDAGSDRLFRVSLDRVDDAGNVQGAVYPFAGGLGVRIGRLIEGPDGVLYAGVARPFPPDTLAAVGPALYALAPTDEAPFELETIQVRAGGLALRFTEAIVEDLDKASFQLTALPAGRTGAPRPLTLETVRVEEGGRTVWLDIPGLQAGEVVHLHLDPDVRSRTGKSLYATDAWYTLRTLPVQIRDTLSSTR